MHLKNSRQPSALTLSERIDAWLAKFTPMLKEALHSIHLQYGFEDDELTTQ